MVAKIISGKSLIGALNYNENKVKVEKAELICENGYAKNLYQLSFNDKLQRLTDLASKNERVITNTVHISLNFDIGEKINQEKLNEIANEYMQRIGFGDQPYLVYQHHDAGHPHVHIVSTNIKPSGERISLHNLGRTKSEEARKAIELKYGLVQASHKDTIQNQEVRNLTKVEYGKTDTKRAITNVVSEVIRSYKFSSLPELNAVLNQYNVVADRGSKESRMFSKNGLVYWVMDNKGNKVGVPIKASNINGKPTLKALEQRFHQNEMLRKPFKERIKQSIDSVLLTKASKAGFQKAMQSKGIQVVFRQNEEGRLYGITFIDNHLKVVFNGSDLGKAYSASAMNDRFSIEPVLPIVLSTDNVFKTVIQSACILPEKQLSYQTILGDLLKTEYPEAGEFAGIIQNKRKKKRKRSIS